MVNTDRNQNIFTFAVRANNIENFIHHINKTTDNMTDIEN